MSDEINAQFGFERAFGKTNDNADADTKIRFRQIQKKNFWIRSKILTGIPSNRGRIKSAEDLIFQFSVFRAG